MKRVLYFITVLGVAALMGLGTALRDTYAATTFVHIKAEGTSPRLEDITEVKQNALDAALRAAVAQSLASFMGKESIKAYSNILESTVYSDVLAYVLNYRLLSEGWITHLEADPALSPTLEAGPAGLELFHIWIEAKLDISRLRKDIHQMTVLGDQQVSPVTLTILGVNDYGKFEEIKKVIRNLEITKELTYRSFIGNMFILRVEVWGDVQLFIEKLKIGMGRKYEVISGGTQRIMIKPAREGKSG